MTGPLESTLILAALEQEEQALLEKLASEVGGASIQKTILNAALGLELSSARLGNRSISVVKTGIGSVNAALALMLAHERVKASSVILLGVGGALTPELDVGDLVISSRVLQHDYFYSFDHADTRIRPGALILSSREAEEHAPEMAADSGLVAWLRGVESRAEARPESRNAAAPVEGAQLASETERSAKTEGDPGATSAVSGGALHRAFVGSVLSGNEFVGRPERKRALAGLLPDALLVEMEAAGVAQTAQRLGIPFVVAKTVADRLNPDGSIEVDFRATLDAACTHAAAALHSLLRRR